MAAGSTFIGALLTGVERHGWLSPVFGRLLAGVFCGLLAGGAAHANPIGPTVLHGSAQFARPDANTLNVTTSSNTIINWQGFSIDAGELTRFTQPNASSAVLNRVAGSDASSILGRLLSNGRVFLVNPNGIVFGEDAVVDTAGLVASTLGIGDEDFLAGRYRFEAGPDAGDITNQGLLKSGADGVFLLAPSIENSGIVRTAGGDLVLAAGRTITLTSLDLDGVGVEVQAPEDEALNLGQLVAERGAVGVFAGSIRNSGTVEANAVTVDKNGTIRLVARKDIILEAGGEIAGGSALDLVLDAGEDVEIYTDLALVGGSLRTEGDFVAIGDGATVTLDGVAWDMNNPAVGIGSDHGGRTSMGTVIVRNDATIDATGKLIVVGDGAAGTGTLRIESGAKVTSNRFIVGDQQGWTGTVTVTGAGSSLTTVGTDNTVVVGDEGTGTLHVLDGGLVDTLDFRVANSGVGRAVVSGIAANGDSSRVIVSPANGRFSGVFADEAGFVRVGRSAGSDGRLEILDGGLLRALDGGGTHGPQFDIARNKGSVGTVVIDGPGSSLEVIQNGPATHGNPDVWAGPTAQLGRRGAATTIIRNGGALLMQGESAYVRVSRDSVYSRSPDPDAGPIDQQSVVNIESGGRMEIDGEGAQMVIGDSGPAANGEVVVTGLDSLLELSGTGNRLVVGNDGGRGRLEVRDGGEVQYGELVVGANGSTTILPPEQPPEQLPPEEVQEQTDAVTDEILPAQDLTEQEDVTAQEDVVGEQDAEDDDEAEDEEDDESEESVSVDESGEAEQEELQPCPV